MDIDDHTRVFDLLGSKGRGVGLLREWSNLSVIYWQIEFCHWRFLLLRTWISGCGDHRTIPDQWPGSSMTLTGRSQRGWWMPHGFGDLWLIPGWVSGCFWELKIWTSRLLVLVAGWWMRLWSMFFFLLESGMGMAVGIHAFYWWSYGTGYPVLLERCAVSSSSNATWRVDTRVAYIAYQIWLPQNERAFGNRWMLARFMVKRVLILAMKITNDLLLDATFRTWDI